MTTDVVRHAVGLETRARQTLGSSSVPIDKMVARVEASSLGVSGRALSREPHGTPGIGSDAIGS
jgi:hypothetical protein